MKKIKLTCLLSMLALAALSQADSLWDVKAYVKQAVYENIAAYNIRNAGITSNGVAFSQRLTTGLSPWYAPFIAKKGYELRLALDTLNRPYPISAYKLYRVRQRRFEYDAEPPAPGIVYGQPIGDERYLVAIDSASGNLKFISGRYYLTDIARDFDLKPENPAGYIPYLDLRTFEMGVTGISFKERDKEALLFSGYSTVFKAPCLIVVRIDDPDSTTTTILTEGNHSIKKH